MKATSICLQFCRAFKFTCVYCTIKKKKSDLKFYSKFFSSIV